MAVNKLVGRGGGERIFARGGGGGGGVSPLPPTPIYQYMVGCA